VWRGKTNWVGWGRGTYKRVREKGGVRGGRGVRAMGGPEKLGDKERGGDWG